MSTVTRESLVQDVKTSKVSPVSSKELRKLDFVKDEGKCYRLHLQFGPNSTYQNMTGLGAKAGWEKVPDPNDDKKVILSPKYVVFELTTDGASVNGHIQAHNEFIEGLSKDPRTASGESLFLLNNLLAVVKVEEIEGKLPSANTILLGSVNEPMLRAYIKDVVRELRDEENAREAAATAASLKSGK